MPNFQFSAAFEKIGHSDFWKNENKKSRNENRISGQRVWAGRATCVLKKKNTETRRVGLPRRKSWVIIQIAGKKGGAPSNSTFPVDYQKFTGPFDLAKDNHQHTIFSCPQILDICGIKPPILIYTLGMSFTAGMLDMFPRRKKARK